MRRVLTVIIVLGLAYLLLWPVEIAPQAWTPLPAPAATGVLASNAKLDAAQRLAPAAGGGAEALAFGPDGQIYTGMEDGRLLRIDPQSGDIELLAQTQGRPLGLKFAPDGRLIIADARRGLLAWDGQQLTLLTDRVQGTPIVFADDLAISSAGIVYFSDASTKFPIEKVLADAFEHAPHGRLLSYDLNSGQTEVLLEDMYFANGVALSPDEDFLLVTETTRYRIRQVWLQGPQAGSAAVWSDNLPGFPDNITRSPRGTYWVALYGPRSPDLDALLPHPTLRKIVWRLPDALQPHPPRIAHVLELSARGEVLRSFYGASDTVFAPVTSALEHAGVLWLGSLTDVGIARLDLEAAP